MELGITQIELTSIKDNDLDSMGNKIKLKGTSLKNFTAHIKNVPYRVVKGPSVKMENATLSESEKSYKLLPNEYDKLAVGPQKPINVKENMLNNMRSKYAAVKLPNIEIKNEDIVENEISKNEQGITASNIENNNEVNPIDEESFNLSQFDNIKNEVLNIREKFANAQKEADDSETELQEVAAQYNEIEKQLQEAETKNKLIRQQRIEAISNQGKVLANIKEKHKALIEEANARKESNQNKILEFKTKIDAANERILSINDDTARQQEIINALSNFEISDNIVDFSDVTAMYEEPVKKIA